MDILSGILLLLLSSPSGAGLAKATSVSHPPPSLHPIHRHGFGSGSSRHRIVLLKEGCNGKSESQRSSCQGFLWVGSKVRLVQWNGMCACPVESKSCCSIGGSTGCTTTVCSVVYGCIHMQVYRTGKYLSHSLQSRSRREHNWEISPSTLTKGSENTTRKYPLQPSYKLASRYLNP